MSGKGDAVGGKHIDVIANACCTVSVPGSFCGIVLMMRL